VGGSLEMTSPINPRPTPQLLIFTLAFFGHAQAQLKGYTSSLLVDADESVSIDETFPLCCDV